MTEPLDQLTLALSDKYTIHRELGRGGMATVYLAEDLKHHRQVAIKVLHPDLAAGLGAERFVREVETSARLHHPHILPLYDSGRTGGQADRRSDDFLYYVMPYVEGESLRDRLDREKQLPVEDALRITREVADALSYAHEHDVIHRDIKPDNIMLEGGHAMVADFGVARAITEAGGETLTSTGLAVGTPTYMSPEQAAAERGIDGRSDLYSLGCLLYEMLAGEPPHTGPTAQAILARRLSEPAPSLRAVRESVPEAVHQTLAKALARAPADRYGTVAEFVEALDRETVGPTGARASRRRLLTGAVAVLAIAGLLLVGYFIGSDRSGDIPTLAESPAEPAVAVFPFRVVGEDLEFWHEGMVDLLSFNLDGVAGLRKIDPQTVLHAVAHSPEAEEGVVPLEAALEIARNVGARYAVTGSVVQLGSGIRLTAEVYETQREESMGPPVKVDGPADSVLTLVDLLALDLLKQDMVPADQEHPSVNLSRITTTSLDALKAYLEGERNYRRARWKEAVEDFRRAVELDSTFARALYRLAGAYTWTDDLYLRFAFADRAARFATGLPERDSLLLVGFAQSSTAAISTLERLTTHYPDDVDGWYALGEAYFHFGGVAFNNADDFRGALEKAIELSPYYGHSYTHLIEDAFARLDSARARELVAAYNAVDPDAPPCPGYEVVLDLAWGTKAERERALVAMESLPWPALQFCAWTTISVSQEALEHTERSDLTKKDLQDERFPRIANLFRMLQARTMRGQIAASFRVIEKAGTNPFIEADAARFAMMFHLSGFPDSSAARWAAGVMAESGKFDDHFWLGALAASEGRTDAVEEARLAIEAQVSALRTERDPRSAVIQAGWAQGAADALRAYAGLVNGDWDRLPAFEEAVLRLAPLGFQSESAALYLRYQVGRMLFDAGRPRDAERYFRTFYQYQWMYLVPAHYYLGQIYEALDRPNDALEHYRLFVDWWRDSDPELRPWWEEGRNALARVTQEPRQ